MIIQSFCDLVMLREGFIVLRKLKEVNNTSTPERIVKAVFKNITRLGAQMGDARQIYVCN